MPKSPKPPRNPNPEQAARYRAALRRHTLLVMERAEWLRTTSELSVIEKVKELERLSGMVRRNALRAYRLARVAPALHQNSGHATSSLLIGLTRRGPGSGD